MIQRTLFSKLKSVFHKGKAIILLGPRQVGKTTLIREILKGKEYLSFSGDDPLATEILAGAGISKLEAILGKSNIVFIDEAQRIPNIGITAKLITDHFSHIQLILSGSSALELHNSMQEPLTGRKYEYTMYPISWEEFEDEVGYLSAYSQFEERLIYGMYPDVINNRSEAPTILRHLTTSYLYKDILSVSGIKKPEVIDKLVKALALQLGNEVSYNELSQLLGIDKATISKYIDLLEKAFIVFRLHSYSRNQRNEIKHNRKIYFYDNGIRNMIINNLNPLDLRTDKGALWENFLVTERIKMQMYHDRYTHNYFWRNTLKQEIDFIEEANGILTAYEFKWKSSGKNRFPASFLEKYAAECKVIDRENFREFVRLQIKAQK